MAEFAAELRRCLAELDTPDAERTLIVSSPVLRESRPHRARTTRSRAPIYVILALVAVAAIVAGILELGGSKGKPKAAPPAGGGTSVALAGVTGYDPQGTGTPGEDNADAPRATDGDATSYWSTEHYTTPQFGNLKKGVGLLLDAGQTVALKSLTLTTDTPGYTAEIQAGDSPAGSFALDSSSKRVGTHTTFALSGKAARYYVVWITSLGAGNFARVNEVKARR